MIDIENDVIDFVSKYLKQRIDDLEVAGDYVQAPSSFPFTSIVQIDNRVFNRMRTVKIENAAVVVFEGNVYSNKVSGKKQEAKKIANLMDEAFEVAGFTRTFRNPIPNLNDASIYRILCRYEAIVGYGSDNKHFLIYQSI